MTKKTLTPGSPEWHERAKKLLTEESEQSMRWFYLSFADDNGFLGAIYIEARGFVSAVEMTKFLGINPGGEVMGVEVPVEYLPPEDKREILLSKEDMEKCFGKLQKWK